jgi:hypothetical protein
MRAPKRPLAHAGGSVTLLAVVVLQAGCGSIGQPLYPALRIPSQVTDLAVVEQGPNLDIIFTIPPLTTEGLPLKEIGDIELRAGPGPTNGWNVDEWAKSSTRIDVMPPDKPGVVQAAIPVNKFIGSEVVVAVRVMNPKGKDAGWSAPKIFAVKPPLAGPTNFHVAADPKGVALTWNASAPSQFKIFRKTEQQPRPILLATATEPNYVDISAEYGKAYQYSIQAVRDNIESDIVGPENITPIDIFPPAVPSGLMASVGIGSVELSWNRNTESDFKEYRVLRSDQGGAFTEIARGLDAPIYSDKKVQSGQAYRYEVSAVDQDGHASEPSAQVEITAP